MVPLYSKEKGNDHCCCQITTEGEHTHKYGNEVPRNQTHTERLDLENGNTLLQDVLKKEVYNVFVAFKILENGMRAPV